MPVVLVVIIVLAWMIILGPNLLKRRSQAGGINSISHFHQSLRILERSGPPPIVAPAYRLHSVDGSRGSSVVPGAPGRPGRPASPDAPVLTVVGADQLPRPALAFLGEPLPPPPEPTRVSAAPRGADDRVPVSGPDPEWRRTDGRQRQLIRKRRRDTLGILVMVFVATLMVGLVPGASVALLLAAVPGVALVGYVAVLVHLRREAEHHERSLHYLDPRAGHGAPAALAGGPAPGARASVYMSGRYAHPSNQAVMAR